MRHSPDDHSDVKAEPRARRRRRWPWTVKEIGRQGDDNTDNLVVLFSSLGLLAVAGVAFAFYHWG